MNVKILITYKDYHRLLKTDVLTPIQTGRAICDEVFSDMIGDDTGDNISAENNKYSELTAQYWAWKNYARLGSPDYIGHMQYRRHFILNENASFTVDTPIAHEKGFSVKFVNEIDANYIDYIENIGLDDKTISVFLRECDCVAVKKANMQYIDCINAKDDFLKHVPGSQENDYNLLVEELLNQHPSYKDVVAKFEEEPYRYFYHMYIMRRELFFEYNRFIFSILFKLDERIDYSRRGSRGGRVLGYLGEFLLSFFLMKKEEEGLIIKETYATCVLNNSPAKKSINLHKYDTSAPVISYSVEQKSFYNICASLISLDENIQTKNKVPVFIFYKKLPEAYIDYLSNQSLNNLDIELYDLDELEKSIPEKYLQCDFLKIYHLLAQFKRFVYVQPTCLFNQKIDFNEYAHEGTWVSRHLQIAHYVNHNWHFKAHIVNILGLDNPYEYFSDCLIICNSSERLREHVDKLLDNKFFAIKTQSDILNYLFKNNLNYFYDNFLVESSNLERRKFFSDKEYMAHLRNGAVLYSTDEKTANNIYYANRLMSYIQTTPFYTELVKTLCNADASEMLCNTVPSDVLRNADTSIRGLRDEFEKVHFPNINRHFMENDRVVKLVFVMEHMWAFRVKQLRYQIQKAFAFGKRYEKYHAKYKAVRELLRDARAMKNNLFSI